MSHRKYWYGLSALLFAVSAVHAAPELAVNPAASATKGTSDEAVVRGGELPLTGSFTPNYCTGFEDTDGWDIRYSICGSEFSTCVGNGPASNACNVKDHVGNGNCCDKDPNEDTGWIMNGLARHCNEPHIDNLHPSPLKSPSSQHMRIQYDPAGGSPVGCQGFGAGCRQRWSSPWDRNQPEINKTTWKYDISYSHGQVGTRTNIRNFFGNLVNGGGIYVHAYLYWTASGYVNARISNPATLLGAVGAWKYDAPDYAQVTVEYNPCENKICYTYAGKPNGLFPTGGTTICTPFGFSPPYGDYCNYANGGCAANGGSGSNPNPPYLDSMTWSQQHENDGQKIDMDNFCITHTPCPDACCNYNNSGLCNDDGVMFPTETTCLAAGGRYFPNVSCAQLGTPGFPPACAKDKGSCCNSAPGTDGTCSDGVLEADCQGSQLTWTKGATCDPEGFQTLCHLGHGMCNGPGIDPTKAPWYCITDPTKPCSNNVDCRRDGFCYGGLCTPASTGTCQYSSAGFCQTMGQCEGGPTCQPNGDTTGCCDLACATPVTCPGGAACLPLKQPCNNVPNGADCAFCEGCDAWPVVPCTTDAQCPSPAPGFAAGTCGYVTYVCNGDADCPTPASGGVCVFPPVSPGGFLCTSNADCVIPAAPPCDEHLGACCESVAGTCEDDVLAADCVSGTAEQLTWYKLQTCAEIDTLGLCDADLGACCDTDTFGGCTDTTYDGCRPTTANPKLRWTKEVLCADVTDCTHKAIPTVSEWGIVVLTLLLLVGAKVYFGRRQAATA